nr:hypothetical protein [Alicyclobacillus tolerans]
MAISHALLFEQELTLMNEPTAALSVPKTKDILSLIRDLNPIASGSS